MSRRDDTPPDGAHNPLDRLRHDLKTPIATIHGHAQLLARSIQRCPSLSEDERVRLMAGLTSIAVAVREMVTLIDGMRHDAGNDGGPRSTHRRTDHST
jgi:K+-sensing histidine kinase KdpD